jgi:hypothetical protein
MVSFPHPPLKKLYSMDRMDKVVMFGSSTYTQVDTCHLSGLVFPTIFIVNIVYLGTLKYYSCKTVC